MLTLLNPLAIRLLTLLIIPLCLISRSSAFDIVDDFSGSKFFEGWDFYGHYDNLTLGDVNWLSKDDSMAKRLTYINPAGNAILKVDNTSTIVWDNKRDSVRLTTRREYAIGSLWIADIVHLPFGCSVWPALWTMGHNWPEGGEIDIIEGINLMEANQMALHTRSGCRQITPPPSTQRGVTGSSDCGVDAGCTVRESSPNSLGERFNNAGGGVFATQFDASGIYIWFWSRADIPKSIRDSTSTSSIASLEDWGNPSASYPSGPHCDIPTFFQEQRIVLDITLCGTWGGNAAIYTPQCGGRGTTGLCYNDNVLGDGSNYNDAYFEIKYVRTYRDPKVIPAPTTTTNTLGTGTPDVSATDAVRTGGASSVRANGILSVVLAGCLALASQMLNTCV